MDYSLFSIIEENLRSIYKFKHSTSDLFSYLQRRFKVKSKNEKYSEHNFVLFLLEELNVEVMKNKDMEFVSYKGNEIYLYKLKSEILEHFEFRSKMEPKLIQDSLIESELKKAYRKAQKYRQSNCYGKHLMLERLKTLNSLFNVTTFPCEGVIGFDIGLNHNPFKRTLEETLEVEIEFSKKTDTSTAYLSEKDIEDYFYKNIEEIEQGLKIIGRQVEVKDGVIDLLALDKDKKYCVIEIKIKEDKRIVWQSIHYPLECKKIYKADSVRMITIAPEYSSSVLNSLKSKTNAEIYSYSLKMNSGKINKIFLKSEK